MTIFCRHVHELPHRLPDGTLRLRCANCGRERAHLLYGPAPAFHRTLGPLVRTSVPTGIDPETAIAAEESAEVAATIAQLERRERYAEIGSRVRRKGGTA